MLKEIILVVMNIYPTTKARVRAFPTIWSSLFSRLLDSSEYIVKKFAQFKFDSVMLLKLTFFDFEQHRKHQLMLLNWVKIKI